MELNQSEIVPEYNAGCHVTGT